MQHKHKQLLLPFLLWLMAFSASAQQKKILHNTYDLDSIKTIHIDIYDKPEIVMWSGNYLMTETKVELYLATQGIFKFYIEKKKRYDFVPTVNGTSFTLKSKDNTRKRIRTKKGECPEIVKVKIFIPDTYEAKGNNTWVSTIKEDTDAQFGNFTSSLDENKTPQTTSPQEKNDSTGMQPKPMPADTTITTPSDTSSVPGNANLTTPNDSTSAKGIDAGALHSADSTLLVPADTTSKGPTDKMILHKTDGNK